MPRGKTGSYLRGFLSKLNFIGFTFPFVGVFPRNTSAVSVFHSCALAQRIPMPCAARPCALRGAFLRYFVIIYMMKRKRY
jgi:hypothetical protein